MPVSEGATQGHQPVTSADDLDASLAATLQHIVILGEKRERLRVGQIAAEEQFLHRAGQIYTAGGMDEVELADLYRAYAAAAAVGFTKRWQAIMPVHPGRMQYLIRHAKTLDQHAPNMPDGTWRGSWPLAEDDRVPLDDTCIVYVLYDEANRPCYVGSTKNLKARLVRHAKEGKLFAWWTAFPCADREAAYLLEDKLLNEHMPYLNKKRGR